MILFSFVELWEGSVSDSNEVMNLEADLRRPVSYESDAETCYRDNRPYIRDHTTRDSSGITSIKEQSRE